MNHTRISLALFAALLCSSCIYTMDSEQKKEPHKFTAQQICAALQTTKKFNNNFYFDIRLGVYDEMEKTYVKPDFKQWVTEALALGNVQSGTSQNGYTYFIYRGKSAQICYGHDVDDLFQPIVATLVKDAAIVARLVLGIRTKDSIKLATLLATNLYQFDKEDVIPNGELLSTVETLFTEEKIEEISIGIIYRVKETMEWYGNQGYEYNLGVNLSKYLLKGKKYELYLKGKKILENLFDEKK